MKFMIGLPESLLGDCQIKAPLRLEVDYSKKILLLLSIGLIISLSLYFVWRLRWDNSAIFGIFDDGPFTFIGSMLIIFFAHEICHVVAHPKCGLSKDTLIGYIPAVGAPYAAYCGVVTKRRQLLIIAMPFAIMSITPLIIASASQNYVPELAWCSILNAVGSGGDVYVFWLMARALPTGSFIQGEFFGAELKN